MKYIHHPYVVVSGATYGIVIGQFAHMMSSAVCKRVPPKMMNLRLMIKILLIIGLNLNLGSAYNITLSDGSVYEGDAESFSGRGKILKENGDIYE